MSRHQQWDIVSGVGITALAVAAGRAVESHRDDALVHDPYAETFVHAADSPVPMPTEPLSGDLPGEDELIWMQAANHMAVRSRYFDNYFHQACRDDIRQAVILASGLDTRAFRLDWPSGMRVFEVDQPRVLDFKTDVLARQDAEPSCEWRLVPTDLRDEWSGLLREGGFDPEVPTAWLAEGLLPYLPHDAKNALMQTVANLSAPGSRIAIEHIVRPKDVVDDPTVRNMSARVGLDITALMPEPSPSDQLRPEEWLDPDTWQVSSEPASSVAARYGRTVNLLSERIPAEDFRFVTACTAA